jgi:hypothetical protein
MDYRQEAFLYSLWDMFGIPPGFVEVFRQLESFTAVEYSLLSAQSDMSHTLKFYENRSDGRGGGFWDHNLEHRTMNPPIVVRHAKLEGRANYRLKKRVRVTKAKRS